MKVALVFVVVAVTLTVASASISCIFDENKCAEDECCVKVTNVMGMCRKMRQLDEKCSMHPLTMLLKKHVSIAICPCAEGMKCVAGDGIVGKAMGTCQEESSEE